MINDLIDWALSRAPDCRLAAGEKVLLQVVAHAAVGRQSGAISRIRYWCFGSLKRACLDSKIGRFASSVKNVVKLVSFFSRYVKNDVHKKLCISRVRKYQTFKLSLEKKRFACYCL